MIYEILNDAGEVINTIVAEEWFVEQNYPGHYRLVGPEPVPYVEPLITKAAFRFRLTDAEYAGILTAAKTDVEVQAWVETFNMVTQIDLDNQRTIDGVGTLVVKGLLTQARADEILTTSVNDAERP
jgi:hypothetical protein